MPRKIFLPYSLINLSNPVFQQEWKRLRWLKTTTSVQRYNWLMWMDLPAIVLIIWLMGQNQSADNAAFRNSMINLLTWISLIPLFATSVYSIPVVVGTINHRLRSDYWNSLRLTTQFNNDVLMAYDAIFQLRLWPFVVAESSLRLSIFIIFVLGHIPDIMEQINPISAIAWLLTPLILIAFLIEPIIRMRLIIALNMLVALRITTVTLAMLVGIISIVAVHLTHIILFDGLWVIIQSMANNDSASAVAVICVGPVALFAATTFWILYISVRNSALALAYKAAFSQD